VKYDENFFNLIKYLTLNLQVVMTLMRRLSRAQIHVREERAMFRSSQNVVYRVNPKGASVRKVL
jgi:hypothetical protein